MNVIYFDYPRASRSGSGVRGKVATAFEHVLDLHPDVAAINAVERALYLFEVDSKAALKGRLIAKARLYRESSPYLRSALSTICDTTLSTLVLVFVPVDFADTKVTEAVPPMDRILRRDPQTAIFVLEP